jgi:hypothetical protein
VFRNDDDDAPDSRSKKDDDDDGLLLLLVVVVVVYYVVYSTRKFELKKRAFGVEIFYALRGTRQDRLWKKKKTNTKKRSAAPSISGQKTTTESSYLGVLPGDLFVELGLRAVPERGADRCAHLF